MPQDQGRGALGWIAASTIERGIVMAKLLFVLVIIAVAMLGAFFVGFVVGTTVTPLSPAVAASVVIRG